MNLPVLQTIKTSEIHVSGDVTIDTDALISPGVILQAAPGSKILIRGGACLGMGVILQAYQGTIEIRENAVLGAGVLVIGKSLIGSQVCVGSSVTIYNTSIESMTIIPAGSVIGDPTRLSAFASGAGRKSPPLASQQQRPFSPEGEVLTPEWEEPELEEILKPNLSEPPPEQATNLPEEWQVSSEEEEGDELAREREPWRGSSDSEGDKNPVVGQVYINKLLLTLFPHKQVDK